MPILSGCPWTTEQRRLNTNDRSVESVDARAIGNDGERVSHLYPNDLYHAHLSLYDFVLPMARDAVVLDAGCGSGYGAAHLASRGARFVHAIDVDAAAIRFCRRHFDRPNLSFECMDVQHIDPIPRQSIDLVFCSNTLEHVPDVPAVFRGIAGVLRQEGAFVLAVPPVIDEAARIHELLNPYHLHVWSPAQWRHSLSRYFETVDMYSHRLALPEIAPDFRNAPGDSDVTETDFSFERVDGVEYRSPTLTALFVASRPLDRHRWPRRGAAVYFVDESVSRRAPGGPAVSPAVAFVEPRPVRQLPGRAWRLVRQRGVIGLAAEGRRYVRWLRLRRQARRLIGPHLHAAGTPADGQEARRDRK